ncbi:MAG: hypothetical protein ACE5JV_00460 [Nitrososphaerales archaeon]
MEIHPSQIPISQFFDVKGYSEAWAVIAKMLSMDFSSETGFKILLPKDKNLAKRIGYTIVNELNRGLRHKGYHHKILYFVYHHDAEHYAIVLASEESVAKLRP